MKLGIEIPQVHLEDLGGITDFNVIGFYTLEALGGMKHPYVKAFFRQDGEKELFLHCSLPPGQRKHDRSVILDIARIAIVMGATHVIAPSVRNNFLKSYALYEAVLQELSNTSIIVIPVWWGKSRNIKALQKETGNGIIGMPWQSSRNKYVVANTELKAHFMGFRSLDEVKLSKPHSMHTNLPLRMAIAGQSLAHRCRRPRDLGNFDVKQALSEKQLERAIKIIKTIKAAGKES